MIERFLGHAEVAPSPPADLDDHQHRRRTRVGRHDVELVATDMDVPGEDGPARRGQTIGYERFGGIARLLRPGPDPSDRWTIHDAMIPAGPSPAINRRLAPGCAMRHHRDEMTSEQPLAGGMYEDGTVVRIGDTVRRPMRASSVAVQALLVHLERVGFEEASRFLGVDDQGREILTYIDGDVPLPPYPAWALTDDAILGLGGLLRRFHDASASFDASGIAGWSADWSDPRGGPLVCHNDLFPENMVFRDGLPIALIDFGEAAPGRPTWDLAIAAEVWAPLTEPRGRAELQRPIDAVARVGLLARGYAFEPGRAAEFVDVIFEERAASQAHMRAEMANGDEVLLDYWREHGGDAQAARDEAWLESQRAALIASIARATT